jgi:integrase
MGHRRGRGEGSIFQRGDGYWVGSVEVPPGPDGRRRKARVVRRYRKDVVAALDELRRQARGGVIPDRSRTVEQYLNWWLDEVMANDVSPGSLREYRTRVNRIVPILGTKRLGKLTGADVQHLANRLADQYPRSATTRAYTLGTLRSALKWAVTAGLIPRNPAEGVSGPRGRQSAKLDDWLTAVEVKRVLKVAEGDDLGAMWWLALNYGLRLGELMALHWTDIDWSKDELTVRQSKTAAGVRTLPLIPGAKRVLQERRRSAGVASIEGFVFVTEYGTNLYDKYVYKRWNALLREAGIDHRCRNCGSDDRCSSSLRRFHVSRHVAATSLLEAGIPFEIVSAILGHAGVAITADLYGRTRADLLRHQLTIGLAARADSD